MERRSFGRTGLSVAVLGFVLETPGVQTAIVGTASPSRFREDLGLLAQAPPRKETCEEIRGRWKAVGPLSWTGRE